MGATVRGTLKLQRKKKLKGGKDLQRRKKVNILQGRLPQRQKEKYFLEVRNERSERRLEQPGKTVRDTSEGSVREQAGRREVEIRSECSEQRTESVEVKEEQIRWKGK